MRTRNVIIFWFPLAATWLMMALELPYIAAIVARMPDAARGLAAFGVATSLAWLIESPIMMLLAAAAALVRGRASYFALRRFAFRLNALVTLGMIALAVPPVFRFVGETLMGLPRGIADAAHVATTVLILWPASIGYRRFYQGILVRHHLTRRVAYGTIVRLMTMSITAAALAWTTNIAGATVGAMALLSGVMAEAAASRLMARHIVRALVATHEDREPPQREIARFYFPLALTSMLSMALGPLVTFGLSRGASPIESLAVWPVVNSFVFVFRSGGVAFQEVGIALSGTSEEAAHAVRRTARLLGAAASATLAVVAFSPLVMLLLERVSGLTPQLAVFAVAPLQWMSLVPGLEYTLSAQRVPWILAHRTHVVSIATAVEVIALAGALGVVIGMTGVAAATAGGIATVAGRAAAVVTLSLCVISARSASLR